MNRIPFDSRTLRSPFFISKVEESVPSFPNRQSKSPYPSYHIITQPFSQLTKHFRAASIIKQ